ncbi:hypothetical protein LINPERPRIM_LOCUS26078 [Linum perenne]
MDPKQGGTVKKGHEESTKTAVSLLKRFGLPEGLLPLENVTESGYVEETRYFWMVQKEMIKHEFKMIGRQVTLDKEISTYFDNNKAMKIRGVKAKELMLSLPVSEMFVDSAGKIHFKSIGGLTKSFPVEAFAAGQ